MTVTSRPGPQVDRDVLRHEDVVITARPTGRGEDVLFDGTISLGARLALVLLILHPVVGRPGLRDLRIALGVQRAYVLSYLDELHRLGLIDVEAPALQQQPLTTPTG